MNRILFERHLFERKLLDPAIRNVRIVLHIDFANRTLFIGEEMHDFGMSMKDYNSGFDIACGPFRGDVAIVAEFIDVYREAFEFGRKRLDEVCVEKADTTQQANEQ